MAVAEMELQVWSKPSQAFPVMLELGIHPKGSDGTCSLL